MDPRELFEMVCEDDCTLYDIIKVVEEIDPKYISVYLDDLEDMRADYSSDEFDKAYKKAYERYQEEYDFCWLIVHENNGHVNEWPTPPNPWEIEHADRPQLYNVLIEALKNRNHKGVDIPEELNTPGSPDIPEELITPEAREIFTKAQELGLMDGNYKWLKTDRLLACFAREMSLKLKLGKGYNRKGEERISWKPFEILFGKQKNKLSSSYNDMQKTGEPPIGIELVYEIFKK